MSFDERIFQRETWRLWTDAELCKEAAELKEAIAGGWCREDNRIDIMLEAVNLEIERRSGLDNPMKAAYAASRDQAEQSRQRADKQLKSALESGKGI